METDTTTTTVPPPTATLACGHDIYVTPAQSAAGQAYHCGQFRDITRLPGEAAVISLASCGHPANEDGEHDCAWWPERAPDPAPGAYSGSSVTDEADPSEVARRAASVAALRGLAAGYAQLADAIEAHPAIPAPYLSSFADAYVLLCAGSAEQLAAAARALPCTLRKKADEKYFELHGDLGGLDVQLYAVREKVCTITGYEDREVDEVVTPEVTRKVTRSMPVWECAPILAARPEPSTP